MKEIEFPFGGVMAKDLIGNRNHVRNKKTTRNEPSDVKIFPYAIFKWWR